ncbi:GNAT family N-acetyltransferase [Taibaiella koreensis]|uniref:GNAT family N-acetyltransferase n=1 Tax=Taibaiella koreensis TaxID=1268548 RepID=UPI000E59E95D|nr:GNAT family N-acetyltransferase [Taibaiella koreensis]
MSLPKDYVPATTYWLTDESGTVYGTIRYRPVLNEYLSRAGGHIGFDVAPRHRNKGYGSIMLGLLLQKIDRRQNSSLLLTCDTGNIASRSIIEKNGGISEPGRHSGHNGEPILRYRIDIA